MALLGGGAHLAGTGSFAGHWQVADYRDGNKAGFLS